MKNTDYSDLVELMMFSEENMPNMPRLIVSDEAVILELEKMSDLEVKDGFDRTPIMYAVIYCRPAVVSYLLGRGAEINAKEQNGFTPLHFAVQSGNLDIVNRLLKAGADANAKNVFGNNPLMVGNLGTDIRIFEELILHGADPYRKNNYGICAADIFERIFKSSSVISAKLQ